MGIPHAHKPASEIEAAGGAYVRRRFEMGTRELITGDTLTAEEVRSIPTANLRALINTGRLELWPAAPGADYAPPARLAGDIKRFAVHVGSGRYHVFEGVQLTDNHIPKEEAEALVKAPASTSH